MNAEFLQIFWPFSITALLLLVLGVYCLIATYNLIRVLIGVELLVKAVTLFIILVGYATNNIALTQALVITLIVIEVVIMVVAGGVIVAIFRHSGSIDTRNLRELKG